MRGHPRNVLRNTLTAEAMRSQVGASSEQSKTSRFRIGLLYLVRYQDVKHGEHTMPDTKITPDASILDAFKKWINQDPGLARRDYGDIREPGSFKAYREELRSIQKDGTRARKALKEARAYPFNGEAMKEALNHAFSGRLSWVTGEPGAECGCNEDDPRKPHFEYTTGQYWPTEYRAAAATVLESYCHAVRPKYT